MPEQLVDLLPEARERSLTWDLDTGEEPPEPGTYLVSLGKQRKPGSVYVIVSLRKTNGQVHKNRYALKVVKANDLLPLVKVGFRWDVTVGGEPAYAFIWNPRNKKKHGR